MDPSQTPIPPLALVAAGVVLAYGALAVVRVRPTWVVDRAGWVLGGLAAITLVSALLLVDLRTLELRVRLDSSEEPLMLRSDPARANLRRGDPHLRQRRHLRDRDARRRRVHVREPVRAAPHLARGAEAARRASRREPGGRADLSLGRHQTVARRLALDRRRAFGSRGARRPARARAGGSDLSQADRVARRLGGGDQHLVPRDRRPRLRRPRHRRQDPGDRAGRKRAGTRVPLRGPSAREVAHRPDHGRGPDAPDSARGGGRDGGGVPDHRLDALRAAAAVRVPDLGALDLRPARGDEHADQPAHDRARADPDLARRAVRRAHRGALGGGAREGRQRARRGARHARGRVPARVPLRRDHHRRLRRVDPGRHSGHRGARPVRLLRLLDADADLARGHSGRARAAAAPHRTPGDHARGCCVRPRARRRPGRSGACLLDARDAHAGGLDSDHGGRDRRAAAHRRRHRLPDLLQAELAGAARLRGRERAPDRAGAVVRDAVRPRRGHVP